MSVYLITGASSDVGTALIDRLYREGDGNTPAPSRPTMRT